MQDDEFFDTLYQGFTKTTHAEDAFWGFEEDPGEWSGQRFEVFAMTQDQRKHHVGYFSEEADVAFVTAIHGALPDLVRRMHTALDEAERLDTERDEQEGKYAEALLRQLELQQEVEHQKALKQDAMESASRAISQRDELQSDIEELIQKNDELMQIIETLRSKAADALWKTERPM